jgi:hypothetical protein
VTSEDPVDACGCGISAPVHNDQDGMRAIGVAVAGLADDPFPAEGFHRGRYHRLRVGPYRVLYVVESDLITVERVDRITGD